MKPLDVPNAIYKSDAAIQLISPCSIMASLVLICVVIFFIFIHCIVVVCEDSILVGIIEDDELDFLTKLPFLIGDKLNVDNREVKRSSKYLRAFGDERTEESFISGGGDDMGVCN